MAKTLLFTEFRSHHDLRFFEKRVNTSVFCIHQDKKIGSKSAKHAVIYRGVAPSQAKNCVNTSVSASKSCQNTAIYSVSCLPRCLKLQKHCKYQHFLRSTRQKCCNLQCFFAWLSKTLVFAVFCASRVQKVLVFTAFSAFLHGSRQRRLKRKNVVIYSILWLPKSEKSSEKCVKTVLFSDFWDLQNASSNFTLFLSTPDPEKRENPTRLKDFWGGSAAGARPRVAKAMLSFPTLHGEASPDFLGWRPSSAPPDHSALHFIAVRAWKLLNEDLLQK